MTAPDLFGHDVQAPQLPAPPPPPLYPAWRVPTDAERAICEHFTADARKLPGHVRTFATCIATFVAQSKISDNLSTYMCRVIARNMPEDFSPAVVELARAELDRMRVELQRADLA